LREFPNLPRLHTFMISQCLCTPLSLDFLNNHANVSLFWSPKTWRSKSCWISNTNSLNLLIQNRLNVLVRFSLVWLVGTIYSCN
jgi:hypothetical protein